MTVSLMKIIGDSPHLGSKLLLFMASHILFYMLKTYKTPYKCHLLLPDLNDWYNLSVQF